MSYRSTFCENCEETERATKHSVFDTLTFDTRENFEDETKSALEHDLHEDTRNSPSLVIADPNLKLFKRGALTHFRVVPNLSSRKTKV